MSLKRPYLTSTWALTAQKPRINFFYLCLYLMWSSFLWGVVEDKISFVQQGLLLGTIMGKQKGCSPFFCLACLFTFLYQCVYCIIWLHYLFLGFLSIPSHLHWAYIGEALMSIHLEFSGYIVLSSEGFPFFFIMNFPYLCQVSDYNLPNTRSD